MRRKSIVIGLFCMISAVAVAFAQTKQNDLLSMLLTEDRQRECGVHKLTQSERTSLSTIFGIVMRSNRLGDSAVEYLKSEGWKEVNVIGTRRLKLNDFSLEEEYVIAKSGFQTYILRPKLFSRLTSGKYLGKKSFYSWEIIGSQGTVHRFSIEDTR